MNSKRFGAILLALMVLLSGAGALAGTVAASNNAAFGGTQADSADQTNDTRLWTNSDLDNVSVMMTENQTGDTSYFYSTPNVTVSSVDVTMGSGSLSETNIVDDGYYVNVSATGDVVDSVNTTVPVNTTGNSSGNVSDYINVSYENWMENKSVLIEDPDASEVQHYLIMAEDKAVDTDVMFTNGNITFNESAGEIQKVNGSDATGQVVVTFTRNDTTYEGIPFSTFEKKVGFDTDYFSNIQFQDDESLEAGEVELKDVRTEDGKKTWVLDVVNANNGTMSYTATYNVTVQSGATNNSTFVHSSVQDPDGGVQTEADSNYTHAIGGTLTGPSPNFFNIGDVPMWVLAVGGAAVLILVYTLWKGMESGRPYSNSFGASFGAEVGGIGILWWFLTIAGVWMLLDGVAAFAGISAGGFLSFWTGQLGGGFLGNGIPVFLGTLLIVFTGAVNMGQITDPGRSSR